MTQHDSLLKPACCTCWTFPLRLRHLEASTRPLRARISREMGHTCVQHAPDHAPRAGRRPNMPPQHNGLLSLHEQASPPLRCGAMSEHQEHNSQEEL
jgi:hypothetical protein